MSEEITGFNYVNIVGKECEGWMNLFFDDDCMAMIDDVNIANKIRQAIPEKIYPSINPDENNFDEEFILY